jgi:hypothetical protein
VIYVPKPCGGKVADQAVSNDDHMEGWGVAWDWICLPGADLGYAAGR